MAVRKVIQAGDPRLKSTNKPISNFKSPKTQKIIKDLVMTMQKTGLIGIAATQIAVNRMMFVTYPRSTKARKLGKADKLRVFINPNITFLSKNQSVIYEGCGSVAEGAIFGPVSRPSEIEIEATDEKGAKFSLRCDGILARVIQHEMDHLNGTEFLEKVSDYSKIIVKEHYRKHIRNSKLQRQNAKITKIDYKIL